MSKGGGGACESLWNVDDDVTQAMSKGGACECPRVGVVGWLSGGFTPCRHLRPSSGREHTIVTYSVR